MKKIPNILFFLFCTSMVMAQNIAFEEMLNGMYKYSVPLIKSDQLNQWLNDENVYILDAREPNEYAISHIKGAWKIGYDEFKIASVKNIPKDAKIIVYCSVGYRSERIGEKLIKQDYGNVFNLYGGIFDWINQGNKVYDSHGEVTKVHAYNKDWGRWLKNSDCEKIY